MRFSKVLALAGFAVAVMLPGASSDARPRGPGLVLYQQDYFRGASYEVYRDEEDLGWRHFDDRTSSVEVRYGVWELCADSRFRGRCITVDHDVRKLDRMGMDDRISSVRRIR